jgi:hypothetical protein
MKYIQKSMREWCKEEIQKNGSEYGTIYAQRLHRINVKDDAFVFPFYISTSGCGHFWVFTGKTKLDALIEYFKFFGGTMKNENEVVFNKGNESIRHIIGKGGSNIKEIALWYGKRINVKEVEIEPYKILRETYNTYTKVFIQFYNGKKDNYETYIILSDAPDFHTESHKEYINRQMSATFKDVPLSELFKDLLKEFNY